MKEEIVSLEVAKLAKGKEFDWKVVDHYRDNELIHNSALYNFNDPEEQAMWNIQLSSAPTQSLLQKWLREVHNIHIIVKAKLVDRPQRLYTLEVYNYSIDLDIDDIFDTYELALEEGLKKALKLIKN